MGAQSRLVAVPVPFQPNGPTECGPYCDPNDHFNMSDSHGGTNGTSRLHKSRSMGYCNGIILNLQLIFAS
jgi:hypothetical protein